MQRLRKIEYRFGHRPKTPEVAKRLEDLENQYRAFATILAEKVADCAEFEEALIYLERSMVQAKNGIIRHSDPSALHLKDG